MYITGRERKVLELLLDSQGNRTIQQLAEALEVSSRTIHRDLKNLEETLADYQLALNKKTGVGVQIEGDPVQKQAMEVALFNADHTDYTPDERQVIILSTLLEANEPVKLFALADELNVTMATVSNDLDKIEEAVKDRKLTLIRKRGYGVKVSGKEEHKRAVLSGLILNHIDEFEFVNILRENIKKKSKQPIDTISNRLLGLVDKEKLYVIEKSVERMQKTLPYELADSAYIGLVVHLALAIERLQKGETIHFDQEYLKQINDTREYEIAGTIIKELETALTIEIPDDEIGYITMHLMGAKLRGEKPQLIEEATDGNMEKIKALIRFVSVEINQDLTENSKLFNDLVSHLKPTIYRINQDMNIHNPLIEEIRRDYGDLFEIIDSGVRKIFPDITFPEEEIGYLVLHFASVILSTSEEKEWRALVICSSGIGTAKMLGTRLIQEFPEIGSVENISLFELDKTPVGEYDLIVSTVPIKGISNRYIHASPILTDEEIRQIEKTMRRLRINHKIGRAAEPFETPEFREESDVIPRLRRMQHYAGAAADILSGFFARQVHRQASLDSALDFACGELEQAEIITDKNAVLEKIYARENLGGLGVPGTSLALYHARAAEVNAPAFAVFFLPKPVEVKGMDGSDMEMERLLVMLAPEDTTQEALEVIGEVSSLLVGDSQIAGVFETGSEQEIRRLLTGKLNTFVHEKVG